MSDYADILNIVGVNREIFSNYGEDVTVRDEREQTEARIFRRGGKVVYRSGDAVSWCEDDTLPIIRLS